MSARSAMASRACCGTCRYWEAYRKILPFSVEWSDHSARCSNRSSSGFRSSRSGVSGCRAWSGLTDSRRR